LPCLTCGSHDARQLYENGTSFCFSCRTWFPPENEEVKSVSTANFFKKKITIEEIKEYSIRGFKDRGITKEVCEFFGVRASYDENGEIDTHYYPYDNGKSWKVRKLPKEFSWVGKSENLFGMEQFPGAGKRVIIVEGEIDALSVAKASLDKYNKIYPVVSVSSATFTEKNLINAREWLRSFQEIVLAFDEDERGQEAKQKAIKILGIDKVKITKLPFKDPNEVLQKAGGAKLLQCVFDAAPYIPSGIITKNELWEALVEYNNTPSVEYPECIGGINSKTKGARLG